MVLVREVSGTIQVTGVDRLFAALVLDLDTGLVRGITMEATVEKALGGAFDRALTQPAAELPPGWPHRVLCPVGLAVTVREALSRSAVSLRSVSLRSESLRSEPLIDEVPPNEEAEDIFDSFLGHVAGRAQPAEMPTPPDWRTLIGQALAYRVAEPWTRWSDVEDLSVELRTGAGDAQHFTAVVMGQAGVQRGLVLYPGEQLPAGLRSEHPPEQAPPPPAGTLMLMLDPEAETPVELVAKAVRYGWPSDGDLVPMFLTSIPAGSAEIGRDDARLLSAAIAGVLALDHRGPTLAEPAAAGVSGELRPPDGEPIAYQVRHRPTPAGAEEFSLRLHLVGRELIPEDTPVTLGSLSWPALTALRGDAQVYRPAPAAAPEPAGSELPLLVVIATAANGARLAAAVASLDPYGVGIIDTDDGHTVLVLAGGNAAELLMRLPTKSPALAALRRRLRQTHGRHVVMVADEASARGEGAVYGLFECHQPPLPSPLPSPSPSPSRARTQARPPRRGRKKPR